MLLWLGAYLFCFCYNLCIILNFFTLYSIHERSAREKIFSAQVAHVLNDETTRKWIQSIERLMTFCQTKYPPEDNSQLMG